MKLLVIDANLINSAIRKPQSRIGRFILRVDPPDVDLYAPTYLQAEITRHLPGISKDTGLEEVVLSRIAEELYERITFIADSDLPYKTIIQAMRLVRDIDPDDVLYVALNDEMNGILFTGDMQLYKGLKAKGYTRLINFSTLMGELGLGDDF
jgi:predicted nucleic acid-binding protein